MSIDCDSIMDHRKNVSGYWWAVIAILAGMIIAMFWNDKKSAEAGIKWTSKVILQTAVVLLGFGMNLGVIFETGKQSLPIIICTITTSLVLAWVIKRF